MKWTGLWTAVLKPRVRHFGRRHLGFWPSPSWCLAVAMLVFWQPEVTREGGAKYNRSLNKTFLTDQNVTINY